MIKTDIIVLSNMIRYLTGINIEKDIQFKQTHAYVYVNTKYTYAGDKRASVSLA